MIFFLFFLSFLSFFLSLILIFPSSSKRYATFLPVTEASINLIRLLVGALVSLQQAVPPGVLFEAASRNRSVTISTLIEAGSGVDVNVTDEHGRTPLHYAAGSFGTDSVRVLLNSHALCDIPDKAGVTPLVDAARQGCGLIGIGRAHV